jgi:phosphatidylglycerol:prolipoprotein diacylglycerol transferase
MLGAFFWDPAKEMFSFNLPFLGRPILWYGFFFALGFFLGYLLLVYLLKMYFFQHPFFVSREIFKKEAVDSYLKQKKVSHINDLVKGGDSLDKRVKVEKELRGSVLSLKGRAKLVAEKTLIYAIVGVLCGARLGDVIFYQGWRELINNPLFVFEVWKGGLASHGGVIGVLLAFFILVKREKELIPGLSFVGFLDLVCMPSAVLAGFIRIGNFVNQEILGKTTCLPWGVIFGHPADGTFPTARHPVQLYEAFFYFMVAIGFFLSRKVLAKKKQGYTAGLFLVLVFTFRFMIEFWKLEQSVYLGEDFALTMGQILSVPLIAVGFFLLFRKRK